MRHLALRTAPLAAIERGGAWTLQRLVRETAPIRVLAARDTAFATAGGAEVLLQTLLAVTAPLLLFAFRRWA